MPRAAQDKPPWLVAGAQRYLVKCAAGQLAPSHPPVQVSTLPAVARRALMTSTAAATLFAAGSANAATELMAIADADNRAGLLLTLFVPALGWVAFNILPGLKNQLDVSESPE